MEYYGWMKTYSRINRSLKFADDYKKKFQTIFFRKHRYELVDNPQNNLK